MKTIKVISIDEHNKVAYTCVNALKNKKVSGIRITARYTNFWW